MKYYRMYFCALGLSPLNVALIIPKIAALVRPRPNITAGLLAACWNNVGSAASDSSVFAELLGD